MRNNSAQAPLWGAVAAAALLAGCGQPASEPVVVPDPVFESPGDLTIELLREPLAVSEVAMEALDGRTMSTGDWRGKVALVNFWATWCGPCREEIPHLIQLQERYPDHLQVIGISTDEGDPANVAAFADRMGVNYPIVMATPELNREFPGVFALPTSFIVDPDGRIVQTHVGLISPNVFEQEVRHLTALPTTVNVELIDANDTTRLVTAAHATSIPGLDLSELTSDQKERVLQRLNEDGCPCGCSLTLAQCRINDASCGISPPLAERVVAEIVGSG
ncbi:MAG: TlpA disulfide reductase family protein [Acidobacteria bacterium]|nr:TlpA disulfide reductase family protein [Acidobacteriota bacterium]